MNGVLEDAKEIVVGAGEDDQLVVRQGRAWEKHEQPVFCQKGRRYVSWQAK